MKVRGGETGSSRPEPTSAATPKTTESRSQSQNKTTPINRTPGGGGESPGDRDEQIRRRAYELWEQRGRRDGGHEEDWYDAEKEILGKQQKRA